MSRAPRTGLTKIKLLARAMCIAIGVSAPAIRKLYGDNTTLMAALDTALAACELLAQEADLVLPQGV